MQLEAADVFRLVGEHLRATEEAEAMRISLGGKKKVTTQVHHDSSREGTPVRQSSGRGSHHQSRSRSNTPKGDMDFTPKPPSYPPPQAPTYAQAIQYAPPQPPVVQTIPKLPYQVWDPFAAMWTDTPGARQVSQNQTVAYQPPIMSAPQLPVSQAPTAISREIYPRPTWDSPEPGKGKGKGKGIKGGNTTENLATTSSNNDNSWGKGKSKGDSKGKGKSTSAPGQVVAATQSSGRTPVCRVCEAAGRLARHEESKCTFANPPMGSSIA